MNMAPELMQLLERFEAIYQPLRDKQFLVADFVRGDNAYPYWAHMNAERGVVADHIEALEYMDDNADAGSTTSMSAVLGVPVEMLADVRDINELRTQLVVFLRQTDKEHTPEGVSLSKYLLEKVDLRRFNRKAAGRTFRVLDAKPDSVSFTWAQTISIKKINKQQAVSAASNVIKRTHETQRINALLEERAQLLTLPDDEILARVYYNAPQPKVNIIMDRSRLSLMTAHLPLFYPAKEGDPLPQIVPLPAQWEDKPRLRRSDAIIEDKAFAPMLNIHRYTK